MKRILILGSLVLIAGGVMAQKKPNILWITIEDASPRFIGAYGNKDARTPEIDQLAKQDYTLPANMHSFPYYMQQAGYHTSNNAKTDYNVFKEKEFIADAWNESSGKAGWWNRKPGQPFFSVFNYNDSHQSRTMTDPYPKYIKTV